VGCGSGVSQLNVTATMPPRTRMYIAARFGAGFS
jgi:hypothetical protein